MELQTAIAHLKTIKGMGIALLYKEAIDVVLEHIKPKQVICGNCDQECTHISLGEMCNKCRGEL